MIDDETTIKTSSGDNEVIPKKSSKYIHDAKKRREKICKGSKHLYKYVSLLYMLIGLC